mgnify:FL=1
MSDTVHRIPRDGSNMICNQGQKLTLETSSGRSVRVRLEINSRARRLLLRVDPKQREGVAIAPRARDLPAAVAFARERADWLEAQMGHLPVPCPLVDGAVVPLRGVPCRLSLSGPGRTARLCVGTETVLSAPGDPETFAKRIVRYFRKAALSDLGDAVDRHCGVLGVTPRRVSVKDTRSRWGSCTADGRLAFSWRLVLAPPEVLDYVAAHECAHLLEMNHSERFWRHVAACRPDWKDQRDWLRQHGADLHAVGA